MAQRDKPKAEKRSRTGTGAEPADLLAKLSVRRASKHGGYGWVRDLPDSRDFLYAAPLYRFAHGLPATVDLRSQCPPIYNQDKLRSCTGNAIAAAIQFDQQKLRKRQFVPSRLFIYYNERVIEGTTAQDAGAQARDGIKSVATLGAPPEKLWPYDVAKVSVMPSAKAYSAARQGLVSSYARVTQDLIQMQGCLAEGYPFVAGFTAYVGLESRKVAESGVVPMPSSGEKVAAAHCVLVVGYRDTKRAFIIRNSWGPQWGMKGYCTMPYEYLLDPHLAGDFWTIRSVTE